MECSPVFPDKRVEPWHAVFPTSDITRWGDDYRAANRYGQHIVDLGFAWRWWLIAGPDDCIHVIPTNDRHKTIADYFDEIYEGIVDNNDEL